MRFSLFQLPCYREGFSTSLARFYDEFIDQVVYADRAGWSRVYVSEHHFHYYGGAVPNPAMILLAYGRATKNIRLAPGISLLPFHHPVKVAEDFAMLDQLTGGRLDFGIGRGYLPHEFAGFDIPIAEQQERFDEVFSVVRRAWTGDAFSHEGKYFKFGRLVVLPQPLQAQVPVVIAASRTRDSFEFAGRNGFGLMMNRYPLSDEQLVTCLGWYKESLAAHGHDIADKIVMISHMAHIADTTAQAMDEARIPMREHLNCFVQLRNNNTFYTDYTGDDTVFAQPDAPDSSVEQFLLERTLVGSVDRVADEIERYRAMGFNEVAFCARFGALTAAQAMRTTERLEREVRPLLKA